MRWYYPFVRRFPQRRNAWKRQPERVKLAQTGGHRVWFPDLHMYPESFKMRHYLFLSVPHAIDKWVNKNYDLAEIEKGWHHSRNSLTPANITLPSQKELRYYTSDGELDPSEPLREHLFLRWPVQQERER